MQQYSGKGGVIAHGDTMGESSTSAHHHLNHFAGKHAPADSRVSNFTRITNTTGMFKQDSVLMQDATNSALGVNAGNEGSQMQLGSSIEAS